MLHDFLYNFMQLPKPLLCLSITRPWVLRTGMHDYGAPLCIGLSCLGKPCASTWSISENTISGIIGVALTSDLKKLAMRDFVPIEGNVTENVSKETLKDLEMSSDEIFMYQWAVALQKGLNHFKANPQLQVMSGGCMGSEARFLTRGNNGTSLNTWQHHFWECPVDKPLGADPIHPAGEALNIMVKFLLRAFIPTRLYIKHRWDMTEQAKCILYFVKQVKKLQDDNISDQDATDVVMKSVAHTSAKLIEIQKNLSSKNTWSTWIWRVNGV